jgi:hypothetical protein
MLTLLIDLSVCFVTSPRVVWSFFAVESSHADFPFQSFVAKAQIFLRDQSAAWFWVRSINEKSELFGNI